MQSQTEAVTRGKAYKAALDSLQEKNVIDSNMEPTQIVQLSDSKMTDLNYSAGIRAFTQANDLDPKTNKSGMSIDTPR